MLETRTSLRFYCPSCGAGLHAPRADAGSAIECDGCGELIRVPKYLHPKEADGPDVPLIPPAAAAAAGRGLRLLNASLAMYAASVVLAVIVVAAWAAASGPATVLDRDTRDFPVTLAVTASLECLLTSVGAGLRWAGYGRCRPAAAAVRAAGWVTVARVGAAVFALGAAVAVAPGLAGIVFGDVSTGVKSAGRIGQIVRIVGGATELGILFVWARVLTEAGGRSAARQVVQYATTLVLAAASTVSVLSLAGMVTVLSLRPDGPLPENTPGAVPPAGWVVLTVAVSVAAGFALLLSWQYYHILGATRAALPGAEPPRGRPA